MCHFKKEYLFALYFLLFMMLFSLYKQRAEAKYNDSWSLSLNKFSLWISNILETYLAEL